MFRILFILLLIFLPAGALRAQPAAITIPTDAVSSPKTVTPSAATSTAAAANTAAANMRVPALSEQPSFPPPPDTLRIVVIGSSTAAGYGVSEKDSAWVWRYRMHLSGIHSSWNVVNLGVGGYSTYQLQPTWYRWPSGRPRPDTLRNITRALAMRPSAVIINLPSNDAASNFSIVEQSENYERIAEEAARAGVPLWVSTTQPRDLAETKRQNLITMRDWIRGRFADRTLDFWTGLAGDDGSLLELFNSGDGIHLNEEGHALLFSRVRDAAIPEELSRLNWIAETAPSPEVLQLYPNPSRGMATLRLKNGAAGPLRIMVQDMLGRTVQRERERYAPPGEVFARLDLSTLPSGMYVCLVQSPGGTSLQRLLVTR